MLNEPTPRPRRRHLGKLAAAFFSLAVVGLISSELFLRAQYGLGDPPRMMDDPLTEYRYAPDGHYRRRGNAIDINQYSMRSDAFPARKATANERRVLVIGDSIVNGGAQSDQRQLATSILQVELRQRLNVPCVVGNVSAGSWGPQNMLGYVRRFGLLDADAVVIVVSSHDAFDQVTTFPSAEHIQPAPYWFAFGELIDLLWARVTAGKPQAAEAVPGAPGDSILCLDAFGQLLDVVRAAKIEPIVVFHFERAELDSPEAPTGHSLFHEVCESRGIEPVSLRRALQSALATGSDPYRDHIHLNDLGQRLLAETVEPAVLATLGNSAMLPTSLSTRP